VLDAGSLIPFQPKVRHSITSLLDLQNLTLRWKVRLENRVFGCFSSQQYLAPPRNEAIKCGSQSFPCSRPAKTKSGFSNKAWCTLSIVASQNAPSGRLVQFFGRQATFQKLLVLDLRDSRCKLLEKACEPTRVPTRQALNLRILAV
jgi:hypothetical protein